jgi:hypothetical protein
MFVSHGNAKTQEPASWTCAHLRETFFFEIASNPMHSTLAFSHAV